MPHPQKADPAPHVAPSPLVLSDRLLTLAQDADRAGFQVTAEGLLQLAHRVLDEVPMPARSASALPLN